MRAWFLLLFVPAVALADASTPPKAASGGVAPLKTIEYAKSSDGKITATEYPTGTELYTFDGKYGVRVVQRAPNGDYVVMRPDGTKETHSFVELAPFEFIVGESSVSVGFGGDFKIHVRVYGSGELVLEPAGQGFLSRTGGNVSAALVAGVAPVPLVKVSSRPEACSDYWDIYVSVVDGVPRQALALYGVADPPAMQSSTVKWARDGTAVVTTTTSEDEKIVRTQRTRYRFDGRVYVAVPKRAAARSK